MSLPRIPDESRRRIVRAALAEDLEGGLDRTTDPLFVPGHRGRAHLVAREVLVVAGLPLARSVFEELDPATAFHAAVDDGARVAADAVIARVEGAADVLLRGERTALNFLMRMCGVASVTARAVAEIEGTGASILDTRKTIPGWRILDKYAVAAGGGRNHRMGLHDAAMIKDTHLALGISIADAVARIVAAGTPLADVTVEVRDADQLRQAIDARAGRALLDNMTPGRLRECVAVGAGRIVLEASGGLRPGGLRPYAETGVDFLSLGWLTHSARAADVAMEMQPDSVR